MKARRIIQYWSLPIFFLCTAVPSFGVQAEQMPVRASRPDAIVGNGCCDLTHVLSLLGSIKKNMVKLDCVVDKLCPGDCTLQSLCQDLTDCCTNITDEFQQTWTILNSLQVTASVDLSGVFTAIAGVDTDLENCCTNIFEKFNETWTMIANLTFTAFIENLTVTCGDFTAIYTTLLTIETDLNNCCTTINNEFQQTWTILNSLQVTASVDLSEVYTAIAGVDTDLENCCTNIFEKFNETWTMIANLTFTAFIDNLTITCCDFSGVYTVLADILDCCTATNNLCDTSITITAATTITQPGTYCLVNDITGASDAITIAADRVVLDLNNKKITSPSGNGISVTGHSAITIKNGIIQNVIDNGILITTCSVVTISNVDFIGNKIGASILTSTNVLVEQCNFTAQTVVATPTSGAYAAALVLDNSNNCLVQNNELVKNTNCFGILMRNNAHDNVIENNICNQNQSGIYLIGSFNNKIIGNTCSENSVTNKTNSGSGIYLNTSCSHNTIQGNTCIGNSSNAIAFGASAALGGSGIYVNTSCSHNTIQGNTCIGNRSNATAIGASAALGGSGIYVNNSCSQNIIQGNICMGNSSNATNLNFATFGGSGIYLNNSCSQNTIQENTCTDNNSNAAVTTGNVNVGGSGIFLNNDCDVNTILNNTCNDHIFSADSTDTGYGIRVQTGNCVDNVVLGNECLRNSTGVADVGVRTVVTNNSVVDINATIITLADTTQSGSGYVIIAPTTITQPGIYCLANDLAGIITIAADNVVLDLNRKKIVGVTGNGISVSGHAAVTIKNGIIQNVSGDGILIDTCSVVTISNVDFIGNTIGASILTSNNVIVEQCNFTAQTAVANRGLDVFAGALVIDNSNNCFVRHNELVKNINCFGILMLNNAHDNVIENNICNQNQSGIYLIGSFNNKIIGNTCSENSVTNNESSGSGIYLFVTCSQNTIQGNTCTGNNASNNAIQGGSGIYLYFNCSQNTIQGNTCTGNNASNNAIQGGSGIYLFATCSQNTIQGNTCTGNNASNNAIQGGSGIFVNFSCNNNVISENSCNDHIFSAANTGYGIRVQTGNCVDNVVLGNECMRNTSGVADAGIGTVSYANSSVNIGATAIVIS